MRKMCLCENALCPFHVGRDCDNPAMAKVIWHGFTIYMCKQCFAVAANADPANIKFIEEVKVSKLLQKNAQGTGNETFDRVWSDFHGKLADPKNEGRSFHEMLQEHPVKHQLLVSLGKLNYMLENGGFERWIEEGYAFDTGDLLLAKLPSHTHAYPVLSKLRDLLEEVLDSYGEFGVKTYEDLERLLTGRHRGHGMRWAGPSRDSLWSWFKHDHKDKFHFRGGVTEPSDLETISGKWGDIHLEDESVSQDLLDKYTAELGEVEDELLGITGEGKTQVHEREELMQYQADLDATIEAINYRLDLQTMWKEFVSGGWSSVAEQELDELTGDYYEVITMPSLVTEAAELFDATPDEVKPVIEEGETRDEVTPLEF